MTNRQKKLYDNETRFKLWIAMNGLKVFQPTYFRAGVLLWDSWHCNYDKEKNSETSRRTKVHYPLEGALTGKNERDAAENFAKANNIRLWYEE